MSDKALSPSGTGSVSGLSRNLSDLVTSYPSVDDRSGASLSSPSQHQQHQHGNHRRQDTNESRSPRSSTTQREWTMNSVMNGQDATSATTPHTGSARARPITACLTCRNRKIKCDRGYPCKHCVKSDRECRYDSTHAVSVSTASKPTGVTKNFVTSSQPSYIGGSAKADLQRRISKLEEMLAASVDQLHSVGDLDVLPAAPSTLQIHEGRTKYHGPMAWISAVQSEIGVIRTEVENDSNTSKHPTSHSRTQWMPLLFPNQVKSETGHGHSALSFLPPKEHSDILYNIFLDRVVPVIPIVHKPTLYTQYCSFWNKSLKESRRPAFIALLFAIYFSALQSMDPQMALHVCGRDREQQIQIYQQATIQALSEAKFLSTQEIVTMQALALFAGFFANRVNYPSNYGLWIFCAAAFRCARSMGLHRDPSNFPEIEPVEGEIRRRVWFHVFHMEVYSMINSSPYMSEHSFDTKFPRNLNDSDLVDGQPLPESRSEFTEMSHFLFRSAMNGHYVRALELTSGMKRVKKEEFQMLMKDIQEWGMQWEHRWLPKYRDDIKMERMVKMTGRLLLNKALLVLYFPFSRPSERNLLPADIRECALQAACTVIEMNNALETDPDNQKFVYFYATYTQFHCLAILLGELIDNPRCPSSKRIWACVDRLFELARRPDIQWARSTDTPDWEAVRTLYANACKLRQDEPRRASRALFNGDNGNGTMTNSVMTSTHDGDGKTTVDGLQDNAGAGSRRQESYEGTPVERGQRDREREPEAGMYINGSLKRQDSGEYESRVMQEINCTDEMPIDINWSSWDRMMVEGIFNDFLLPGENMAMI